MFFLENIKNLKPEKIINKSIRHVNNPVNIVILSLIWP